MSKFFCVKAEESNARVIIRARGWKKKTSRKRIGASQRRMREIDEWNKVDR